MKNLTYRQKMFCLEYIKDLNAAQASVRAGFSPKHPNDGGAKLMAKPHVRAEVKRLMADREKRLEIAADEIINELIVIAKANAADFVQVTVREGTDSEGNPVEVCRVQIKPTDEIDKEKIAALAGIRQRVCGVEVKLFDKLKAIELLMRHMGLLRNKTEDREKALRIELADEVKEWAK